MQMTLLRSVVYGLILFGFCAALSAQESFIAIAVESPEVDARISRVAARSPYFLIFDENGKIMETLSNPHFQDRRGAGPRVVEFLAAKGVHTLIAGEFGSKVKAAMEEKGMVAHSAEGSSGEAIKQIYRQQEDR